MQANEQPMDSVSQRLTYWQQWKSGKLIVPKGTVAPLVFATVPGWVVGANNVQSNNGSTTLPVAVPTGVASGDLILLLAFNSQTRNIGLATGFADYSVPVDGLKSNSSLLTWRFQWKMASGADTGTYDIPVDASGGRCGGVAICVKSGFWTNMGTGTLLSNTSTTPSLPASAPIAANAKALRVITWSTTDNNPSSRVPATIDLLAFLEMPTAGAGWPEMAVALDKASYLTGATIPALLWATNGFSANTGMTLPINT